MYDYYYDFLCVCFLCNFNSEVVEIVCLWQEVNCHCIFL